MSILYINCIRLSIYLGKHLMNKIVITLLLLTQILLHLSKAVSLKNIETPAPACVERLNLLWYDSFKQSLKH